MSGVPAALVAAQLRAVDGVAPVLLARPRSRVLHVHRVGPGRTSPLTRSGVLRQGRALLCGRSGRRWYAVLPDGRRLCLPCERAALAVAGVPAEEAARLVPLHDWVASVCAARTVEELSAVQQAACTAQVMGRRVEGPDGSVLMSRLIALTRRRLTGDRGPVLGPRDHAWAGRIRPVSYPRRVR